MNCPHVPDVQLAESGGGDIVKPRRPDGGRDAVQLRINASSDQGEINPNSAVRFPPLRGSP
jgi:hypothetical protein